MVKLIRILYNKLMILNAYLKQLWHQAAEENNANLARLLERNPQARVLDLGCDDGILVKERINKFVGSKDIWGVDIDQKVLAKAKKLGLKTSCLDLNSQKLPFKNNFFDVVEANQVIEHLWDTDTFLEEIYRVLKPGGYLVISTENLSSWHNLFALILGFQAPSQDVSSKLRVGNPFSLCQDRPRPWTAHQRVFTLRGLKRMFEVYNFQVEKIVGAGYYPFPSILAKLLTKIDPFHTAFISLKARKCIVEAGKVVS